MRARSLAAIAIASILAACSSDAPEESPSDPTATSSAAALVASQGQSVGTVARLQAAAGLDKALREEPAAQAHAAVRAVFESRSRFSSPLKVYKLETAEIVGHTERARLLGLGLVQEITSAGSQAGRRGFQSQAGSRVLQTDEASGFEALIDRARFHKNSAGGKDLGDVSYIAKGRQYMNGAARRASLPRYPYRVRRFMDAVAGPDLAPTPSLSQVAVSFNGSVDDIPVIGPGSKFTVHMTPSGDVVGHTDSMRPAKNVAAELNVDALIDPAQAKSEALAALHARGVSIDNYTLRREEFGYWREGRHAKQSLLAPHYLFIFEPKEGVMGKRVVELISAVQDESLRRLLEEERRANHDTPEKSLEPDQK